MLIMAMWNSILSGVYGLLHKALVDANGGSTALNYKNIRDGKVQWSVHSD